MPLGEDSLKLDTFFEGEETEGGANSSFKELVSHSNNNYKLICTNINFLLTKKYLNTQTILRLILMV